MRNMQQRNHVFIWRSLVCKLGEHLDSWISVIRLLNTLRSRWWDKAHRSSLTDLRAKNNLRNPAILKQCNLLAGLLLFTSNVSSSNRAMWIVRARRNRDLSDVEEISSKSPQFIAIRLLRICLRFTHTCLSSLNHTRIRYAGRRG